MIAWPSEDRSRTARFLAPGPWPLPPRVWLLLLLFGGLAGVLVLLPPAEERLPPLTVYSAAPAGGKALRLWLDELGYRVSTIEGTPYRVPAGAATVLVLAPTRPLDRPTVDALGGWVRGGGTLVVAADGLVGGALLDRFEVALRALPSEVAMAGLISPGGAERADGGPADPAIGEVLVRAREDLVVRAAEASPFLGAGERVFGAVVPVGAGRVLALSAPAALSNEALRRRDNARLALALIGPAGRGGVAFDELHHGYGAVEPRPPLTVLLDRAWGRAALYAGLLVLAYLLLRGRRFGRPRPVLVERGRSLGEYVTSLAGLYRAGGKRGWVAEHFRRRLRRDLARDVGLAGDATDEEIGARLRARGRDPGALEALRALERERVGEVELVALVRDAEREASRGRRAPSPSGRGSG